MFGEDIRIEAAPVKLPPGVGSKVGQLPPFNPDAEEPAEHLYARATLVAKKRMENRIGEELPINIDHVIECKERGTLKFKEQHFEHAQSHYEDGASLLLTRIFKVDGGNLTECLEDDPRHETAMHLLRVCYLNSAQMCLKLADANEHDTNMQHGCWNRCLWHCSIVMASEPNNTKALARRGIAGGQLRKFPRAIHDLTTAIKLEPQNKELRNALDAVYRKRDGDRQAEKSFLNMSKLSKAIESDEPMVGAIKDPNDMSDVDPYAQARMFQALNKPYEENGGTNYAPAPPRQKAKWERRRDGDASSDED